MEKSKMLITRKSVITGIVRTLDIPVNPEDYAAWKSGLDSIQDVMPYLNDSDKEYILSGITTKEWDNAFSETIDDIVSDTVLNRNFAV
jgi:hypothetical protein|tara:strand:- start:212 stop:475 length:264 start_codon:yes stop_codon:yes gene_type:complete